MSSRISAGILLYRRRSSGVEVLLAHAGGAFHARKDLGSWSIPKGEADGDEQLLSVARREFEEETGYDLPTDDAVSLGSIVQKGGKTVHAWAIEGDIDPSAARSNSFRMEWPPRSGREQEFPEIDRVEWFSVGEARRRVKEAQVALIDRLEQLLGG